MGKSFCNNTWILAPHTSQYCIRSDHTNGSTTSGEKYTKIKKQNQYNYKARSQRWILKILKAWPALVHYDILLYHLWDSRHQPWALKSSRSLFPPPTFPPKNYLQMILCSSDAISLSRDMSIIQVKQNKSCWDKFLQIPANFEIIRRQIWDWNIPRITPNTIQFKKDFHGEGGHPPCLAPPVTFCTLLLHILYPATHKTFEGPASLDWTIEFFPGNRMIELKGIGWLWHYNDNITCAAKC
jgi:hypothetical protein